VAELGGTFNTIFGGGKLLVFVFAAPYYFAKIVGSLFLIEI